MMTDSYNIQINKQPPPFLFSEEQFVLELTMSKQQEGPNNEDDQLTLQANAHLHDGRLPSRESCSSDVARVILDPPTPLKVDMQQGLTQKQMFLTCKVVGKVSPSENVNLSICLSLHSNNVQVTHVYTSVIHLVNYKLYVQPKEWDEAWYKDEGGRDKCIVAQIELHNANGTLATGIRAPIRLALQYGDLQSTPVRNQDLLRILGHPKQFIDPDTGTASIRFRIEDVSKNHQGQDFKVAISADSSRFADIAPTYTPTVSVRSKRTKRQRTSATQIDTSSITSTSAKSNKEERNITSVTSATTAAGATKAEGVRLVHPQQQHTIQQDHILNLEVSTHSHSSNPKPLLADFQGIKSKLQQYASSRVEPSSNSSSASFARKRDALLGILNWAEEVVNGLYPLQWKIVGYSPFPDGSLDHNHPHYSMPNPNSVISKLLSMYSATVKDDLRILMAEMESSFTPRTATLDVLPTWRDQELRLPSLSNPFDYPIVDGGRISTNTQVSTYETRIPLGIHQPPAYYDAKMAHSLDTARGQGATSITPFSPSKLRCQHSEEESQEELESQVMYVLAKQYKSFRTGQRLGFPAFSADKEIIGFFPESSTKVGVENFLSIHHLKQDFGVFEREQASQILKDAIVSRSGALHCVKDYDSVSSLLASVLVFDWSNKGSNNDHIGRSSSAYS